MVETKRETFTVITVGTGQPDYAQPTPLPTERALVVNFPEMEIAGKKYADYAQISFTATQQVYVIGTNANAAKSGSWPSGAIAKEIVYYATEDCWVRFEESDGVPQFVPKEFPLRSFKRVSKYYVYQDTAPGILRAWIEG